jgi:trehalose 6-phosphate synthase/phosphatase
MHLIIVSNRLPVTINKDYELTSSIGGLAKGLDTFLKQYMQNPANTYSWIGWAGRELNNAPKQLTEELQQLNCHALSIDKDLMENFYTGFCNNTIWPIFHNLTGFFSYHEDEWQVYKQVNRIFAEEILKVAKPGDIIWVHDYHLLLLPTFLKELNQDMPVGSFLHIPFPSFQTFKFLPRKCRTEILSGMLGANLVGFHTYEYLQNFTKSVTRMLGYEHSIEDIITNESLVKVRVYPMGIDYNMVQDIVNANDVSNHVLNSSLKVILSIDRLDYTKGISNRLLAYEEFLANNPEWHNKVILNLIVAPSRENVPHYHDMKRRIDELVGNINGQFGNSQWIPIAYQYKAFSSHELILTYASSDVALITPLMDGMNLIAKEYVAAKTRQSGVLILSEAAGASKELMDALLVNPNSTEEMAEAIKYALEMPEAEKINRLKAMQLRLRRYDVVRWGQDFISDLQDAYKKQQHFIAQFITNTELNKIKECYNKAAARAVIFDYDGTLVPLVKDRNQAVPGKELLTILERLAADSRNKLIIVSGRDKETLEKWLGHLNITLIAEHGAWVKQNDVWETLGTFDSQLKKPAIAILESFTDRLPGSFFEEKDFSLTWHYRNSNPENAAWLSKELFDTLVTLTATSELQVAPGNKVIEIKASGINKGVVSKFIADKEYECIIALGDDVTDEDIFKVLPETAFSIKIGTNASSARYNITSQSKAIEFIRSLASSN